DGGVGLFHGGHPRRMSSGAPRRRLGEPSEFAEHSPLDGLSRFGDGTEEPVRVGSDAVAMTATTVPRPIADPPIGDPQSTPAVDATPARPPGQGRLTRLVRGPSDDPGWARPALLVLLAGTAALYVWGLGASGWANAYYSAAVQAATKSWKAFFFGSSDASNFITVDKSPVFLWPMD